MSPTTVGRRVLTADYQIELVSRVVFLQLRFSRTRQITSLFETPAFREKFRANLTHMFSCAASPGKTWERSRRLNFSPIEALASNDLLLAQTRGNGRFSASKLSNLYPRVNAMQCFAYPIFATSVLLQAEAPIYQRASRAVGPAMEKLPKSRLNLRALFKRCFELRNDTATSKS